MGSVDAVSLDEKVGHRSRSSGGPATTGFFTSATDEIIVILFAAIIYLGCIASPPSLMDDVVAVQAQIARNMLQSGDWVTARLAGIPYLDSSPLKDWMQVMSYVLYSTE